MRFETPIVPDPPRRPGVILDGLAVYRLTRFVTSDTFPPIEKLRERVVQRGGAIAELVSCPWCVSPYVAALVVGARRFRWWPKLAEVLAFSAAAGIIATAVKD